MVFTIDVSGSQAGAPLAQERAAVIWALKHLQPDDTFQVIRFGDTAIRLFPEPVPAGPNEVRHAIDYVNSLVDANEGTMLVDEVRVR